MDRTNGYTMQPNMTAANGESSNQAGANPGAAAAAPEPFSLINGPALAAVPAEVAPPIKRGRGRPRKVIPNVAPATQQVPNVGNPWAAGAAAGAPSSSAPFAGPVLAAVPAHVIAPVKRGRGRPRKVVPDVASAATHAPAIPSGLRQAMGAAELGPRGAYPPGSIMNMPFLVEHEDVLARIAAEDAATAAAAKAEQDDMMARFVVYIDRYTSLSDIEDVHGAEINYHSPRYIFSAPRPFSEEDLMEVGESLVAPVIDVATLVTRIDPQLLGLKHQIFAADVRIEVVDDYNVTEIFDSSVGLWRPLAENPLELLEAVPMASGQKRGGEGDEVGGDMKRARKE